jgi:hypothetical protein
VFAFVAPLAVLRGMRRRRMVALRELWPEAVDNLPSVVRAGMSLPFVGALTSSNKRQIKKSRDRFTSYIASERRKVAAWHILRPENATMLDRKFLAGLTSGAQSHARQKGSTSVKVLLPSTPT